MIRAKLGLLAFVMFLTIVVYHSKSSGCQYVLCYQTQFVYGKYLDGTVKCTQYDPANALNLYNTGDTGNTNDPEAVTPSATTTRTVDANCCTGNCGSNTFPAVFDFPGGICVFSDAMMVPWKYCPEG